MTRIKLREGTIFNGDVLKVLMEKVPPLTADLIFTSPPYNIGKDYGVYRENLGFEAFFRWMEEVLKSLSEKLKGLGFIVLNIPESITVQGIKIPFAFEVQKILEGFGELEYYGKIIWKKGVFSRAFVTEVDIKVTSPPLYETFEVLLIYKKKPCSRNRALKPSQIEYSDFLTYANPIWEVAPDITRRFYHPVPFPLELPQRVIRHFTVKGETVLDPFMGIGSTLLAALIEGRKFIGIELNPVYVEHFLIDYETFKKHMKLKGKNQREGGCITRLKTVKGGSENGKVKVHG